jgi:uncharacterized protein (UPF0332 family)
VIEAQAYLDKAERSFRAAQTLAREGSYDFAASRAFYGCFYVAEALLLTRGQRFSSHAQVIGQYGFLFARTGAMDPSFHQLLLRAFKIRQLADYQIEVAIAAEVVDDLVAGGFSFLEAASRYLANPPESEQDGNGNA